MARRRDLLKVLSAGAMNAVLPSVRQAAPAATPRPGQPNIIFIFSDQHRAGMTKLSGYPLDTSPMLDSLAKNGVSFDKAYVTCPVCAPSRISVLTGRWPEAHHQRQNTEHLAAFYEKDLFDVLKAAGYKTGLAGKNHTYMKSTKLDFWREYGHQGGWEAPNAPPEIKEFDAWMTRLNSGVSYEPTPFPVSTQSPYRIVSDAIEFMQRFGDQPFALEVSFPEPHNPEQVPKPYWDMYPPDSIPDRCAGPEVLKYKGYKMQWLYGMENDAHPIYEKQWRRYKSNYLGMLRLLDDQLKRLVDFMQQQNLLEKTIIVYMADHGDYLMDYGLGRKGAGLPECLTRIPMVWSGWGIQAGHPHHPACVSNADVMPTLCEAIGVEIPHGVQGRSLWPLLQGKDYPEEEFRSIYAGVGFGGLYYDESYPMPYRLAESPPKGSSGEGPPNALWNIDELNPVTQSGTMKMVRMGDWKLIYDMMGYGQLYNLSSDPCELKNLFGDPSVAAEQLRMVEELLMWTIRCQDTLPADEPMKGWQSTRWSQKHNWYAPYRHGKAPEPYIP